MTHVSPRRASRSSLGLMVRYVVERLERRTLLAAAGPDAYGYVADAYPFEEINLVFGDGVSRDVNLGKNTFNYYGNTFTGDRAIAVTENGAIQVGSFGSIGQNNRLNTAPFQPLIAALWGRWSHPAGTTTLAKLDDVNSDGVDDRLIVQWTAFADHNLPAVRFHAILELNTGSRPGDIILNYDSLDAGREPDNNGGASTVGIKDIGYNSNRLLLSFNNGANPLIGDEKAIRIHNDTIGQPFAHTGRAVKVNEGASIAATFDATRSTDPNQSSASMTYDWDFDLDGIYGESAADSFGDENGPRATYTRNDGTVFDGPKSLPVALRVTDSTGLTSFGQGWIAIENVAPAPTVSGPTTIAPGEPITISFSANDPGNDGRGFDVDWGDGSVELVQGAGSATHTFYLPGTRTIRVSVRNDFAEPLTNQSVHTITVGAMPELELDANGVLMVRGTTGDDNITLDSSAANARLTRNGVVTTYPLADVAALAVELLGGNNSLVCSLDMKVSVVAGDGNDTIQAGVGSHDIFAGAGDNQITIGDSNDNFDNGSIIFTGDGNDTISADGFVDRIDAGGGDNVVSVVGARNLITGAGNDIITATNSSIRCWSGDGDDSITSGDGSDTIDCGDGNDTVSSGALSDYITARGDVATGIGAIIDGGDQPDRIIADYARRIVGGDNDVGLTDDTIAVGYCPDIDAGSGNDLVRAGSDANYPAKIFGGDGDDNIYTGDGHDSVYAGAGKDTVHAGSGSDLISGGGGNDKLFGQGGADRIYAGSGNDRLDGHTGNDRLVGGAGADTLNGGPGADSADSDDTADLLISIELDLA